MPIFDRVRGNRLPTRPDEPTEYQAMLSDLDELVFCAFHPNAPGPGEIEVIEPNTWHVRTDEYELFRTDEWVSWLARQSFTLTTMRELRADFRAT